MSVREYTPSDYPMLKSWWQAHKWPALPPEMLSSTGIIVDDICAGFLYRTDSSFGWIEWIVSSPSSTPESRDKALDTLIGSLLEKAKSYGIKAVHTSANHERLIGRYMKHGFVVADKAMTNLVGAVK